jgi:hypothetical protein
MQMGPSGENVIPKKWQMNTYLFFLWWERATTVTSPRSLQQLDFWNPFADARRHEGYWRELPVQAVVEKAKIASNGV